MGRGGWRHPGLWALVVWVVCLPGAFVLPYLVDQSPFGERAAAVPLIVGVVLLAVIALLWRRRPSGSLAGVAAGAFSGWVLLAMRTGLYGTPYGFIAGGDTARLSAMAERYTTTLHSADGIVASVPSDYPPMFPWVVGRLSVWTGIPAWRLLGPAETVLASAVLVAGFLLWRRVVSDWLAFVISLATFAVFLAPEKPYEWMAMEVVIPWALATFVTDHGRRRLGWLAAGIIGGLQVDLYQGYLMFALLGIIALIVMSWRRSPRRDEYGWYVVRVVVVACVVASWYLVPYLSWDLSHGLQMTDRYLDPLIDANPFPFLSITPIGVLTAIGLVGLAWYRRRTWWAVPLLALTLSAYVFRFVAEIEFVGNGQTAVFQYSVHAVAATLVAAGVLTLTTAVPSLWRRLSLDASAASMAVRADLRQLAVVVLVLLVGMMSWSDFVPGAVATGTAQLPLEPGSNAAPVNSFLQPLPDGRYPRFAPTTGRLAWFPTDPIIHDVHTVLGPHATPLTLSASELLFATEPWPGYLGVGANAAASTSHWFSRLNALQHLATITTPDAFATASAHTPYGAIDVFILHAHATTWDWTPTNYPATIQFTPTQFTSAAFVIFRGLPNGTELVVRRPGSAGASG